MQTHRPGPLHQTNKAHKTGKHGRKSSTNSSKFITTGIKAPKKVTREQRLHQATQLRKLKKERIVEAKRRIGTEAQAPILIGVLDLQLNSCKSLFDKLQEFQDPNNYEVAKIGERLLHIRSRRLKLRFSFIALDSSCFDASIDLVKSLDILLINQRCDLMTQPLNFKTNQLLRAIRLNCLPSAIHVLDLSSKSFSAKDLSQMKKIAMSDFEAEKVHVLDKENDVIQLFHLLGTCKRLPSTFKDNRPQVFGEKIEVIDGCLTVTGFVRRKRLSADQLVNLLGYDDYQIKKIEILADPTALKPSPVEKDFIIHILKPNPVNQESLDQENDVDPMEVEQTFPTAEEIAKNVEEINARKIIKKLPRGISEYQGAWIQDSDDDISCDDNDAEETESSMAVSEHDLSDNIDPDDEKQDSTSQQGEKMDIDEYDKNYNNEKEMKILEKLKESRQDMMFPDEVDTPFDIPARVRFARYRGLKSFRTSHWDPEENLPTDYSRIYQFQNFQSTKRRVINELPSEGADPGQYVRVHLDNVDDEVVSKIKADDPILMLGLLKYERKMTVMNFLIKTLPDANLTNPVKSKDELIFYVGFRKFKARPIFTNHSTSTKFKYERFLRNDVSTVATVYAPITFSPCPILVFRETYSGKRSLIASGSVLDSNPNRLNIKRIRLAGHPFKLHSKTAVIRFMFFNSEDVQYFKPVELVTRYSRRGHISEPIGTHGHMKCIFDKQIRSDDCVFMNLYKRVFPKWSYKPVPNAS